MPVMFPGFNFEPSKHTFLGMAAGILLVAVLRAALHL